MNKTGFYLVVRAIKDICRRSHKRWFRHV